jgi:aryl-alcohol dehydrogenase-like predicted oxidoreductase
VFPLPGTEWLPFHAESLFTRAGLCIATIHAALDQGITLLDTGDFYGMGHNEMVVGEALKAGNRELAQISVKFGALRGPGPGEFNRIGARRRDRLAESLGALSIRLSEEQLAEIEPAVPPDPQGDRDG